MILPKVHKSAVCLIPPRSAWQQVQEVRCFRDKSFVRWPPHVNLLYPFWDDASSDFATAAARCSQALQGFAPFQVVLESLQFFEHGRSCTLWLDPLSDPQSELCRVQAALVAAFPECTDLSSDPRRGISRFTPHLSLGQCRDAAGAAAAAADIGARWRPERFEAGGVALISRQGFDNPFTVRYLVPFGGGEVQEVNLPYVATVGPAPAEADAGFGLAQWREGVWNFAYGANMCPSKLEGARGLRPLESVPAQLPGWRLSFTHRGGMGNLVRMAPGGEAAPSMHGVLHRLSHADYARLANMEHEYRPEEVEVVRYDGLGTERAVVFVTPADRLTREGLSPPTRYLELLREGARHWGLHSEYVQWLDSLPSVDPRQRGDAYYRTAAGMPLPALPKIRTGSQQRRQQQHGDGGSGRRQGRVGQGGQQQQLAAAQQR